MTLSTKPAGLADLSSGTQSKEASPSPISTPAPPSYPAFSSSFTNAGDCGEKTEGYVPSNSTIGQFSFAPTTQTTVVTTTTTTTTNFPPFVMPAPQGSQTLDPKLYPLASTPTPASIRDIRFSIGGKSIIFNEPEDILNALDEVSIAYHESLGIFDSL